MATRVRGRKRASTKRRATVSRGLGGSVRIVGGIGRWLSAVEVPDRLQREVLGLGAMACAVLLVLPLVGVADEQVLIGIVGGGLRALLGYGAFLVPAGFLWLAAEALFSVNPGARRRRGLGIASFSLAIMTFLYLIATPNGLQASGYLGRGFAELLRLVAGEVGAGIIAFTLGLVGVYLLTGVDALSVIESWRRARTARQTRREARQKEPRPKNRKPDVPVEEVPEDVADPPRPVINLPKRERKPRETPETEPDLTAASEETSKLTPKPLPLPELTKLALYEGGTPNPDELEHRARLIEETLANFKVQCSVREIFPGPAVTLFAVEPGPGVKVRRITELQNDLALALAAKSIRIEAPVPGMARVGIEIPNNTVHTVGLRETIDATEFRDSNAKLPIALGRDVNGTYMIADLAKMPHLLIAGSTGSGKSVCINGIIATFLLTRRPEDLQMVMIDPKMVELAGFNGVPHLQCPVVTDMDKVVGTLRLVLREMEDRYQKFSALGVRNIDGYNLRRQEDPGLERLPYLVVIIDELADLMMTTPEEVETLLVRLAQMARATGIHLLIATQRPTVDVLTGLIKANVPARVAFAVTSQTDSRVILDMPGAERLLGKGDMLFMPPDAAKPQRIQGSFIEDRDLQYLVRHWRKVVPHHEYDPEWLVGPESDEDAAESGEDPLMEQALKIVQQQGSASASMLQRRLRIGYNRAARLIEQMEDEGIVGPADGSRSRPVYATEDDF